MHDELLASDHTVMTVSICGEFALQVLLEAQCNAKPPHLDTGMMHGLTQHLDNSSNSP